MDQGGGYSTTSTIRAIYGSVPFEKASNLHVGLSGVKSRWQTERKRRECPDGFVSIILNTLIPTKKWGNSCLGNH